MVFPGQTRIMPRLSPPHELVVMPRLTIVSDVCYPTLCDGVASILTRTIQELLARGYQIQLVAPQGSEMPGVEIIELNSLPITEVDGQVMPLPNLHMFRRIKAFDPDAILFLDPRLLALQTFWLFRVLFGKQKLVATFHTDNFQYMKIHFGIPYPVSKLIHRVLMNNFSQVISVSRYARRILVNAGVKTTTGLWAGGVDCQLFHPQKRSHDLRSQLLQNGEETIALYVGRVSREKGIDRLVPLFAAAEELKVRWLIVGDGDDKAELERQAEGYPVTFTGKLSGEDLARAYASADLFVFPSQTDTFGLVLIEAMASGIPAMAFNHGGVPDIICHEEDGLVLAADTDASDLLNRFAKLVKDPVKRLAMGHKARHAVESTWDWQESVSHLLQLIAEHSLSETPQSHQHGETGHQCVDQPY